MKPETLANIKNPPVVYARQANIANGPQQINNSIPAASRVREEKVISSNELLEHQDGERLDTRTAGAASRAHTAIAVMGKIDQPENG